MNFFDHFDVAANPLLTLTHIFQAFLPRRRALTVMELVEAIQRTFELMAAPPVHPKIAALSPERFQAFRDGVWGAFFDHVRPKFLCKEFYDVNELVHAITCDVPEGAPKRLKV